MKQRTIKPYYRINGAEVVDRDSDNESWDRDSGRVNPIGDLNVLCELIIDLFFKLDFSCKGNRNSVIQMHTCHLSRIRTVIRCSAVSVECDHMGTL